MKASHAEVEAKEVLELVKMLTAWKHAMAVFAAVLNSLND
jgi:hypothetical protein